LSYCMVGLVLSAPFPLVSARISRVRVDRNIAKSESATVGRRERKVNNGKAIKTQIECRPNTNGIPVADHLQQT
jgi:hypothetical protein